MKLITISFILIIIYNVYGFERRLTTQDKIRRKLLDDKVYKKQERPDEFNSTEVMVYMKIIAIDSVDVRQMQYSIDVYLRQVWVDQRLAWEKDDEFKHYTNLSIVSPSLKYSIWIPDLFFRNGKKGYIHNMTTPNFLMRLKSNGEVLYSQKITMVFSCQMELHAFPMDTQKCEINIGSYGYTLEELRFYWRDNDTIVINRDLRIPEFNTPEDIITIDCTRDAATATGNYTCLKAILEFKRQLGSYLASTYIPSTLIILVSWMNFWVSIEAVPARVTLGLLSLLGIVNQAISIASTLPRVSYIKAIDVWLIACIVFIIAALLEFAIATTVSRKQNTRNWRNNILHVVREEITSMHDTYSASSLDEEMGSGGFGCGLTTKMNNGTQSIQRLLSGQNNRVGVLEMASFHAHQQLTPLPPGMEMLFSKNPTQNEILLKQIDLNEHRSKFVLARHQKSKRNSDSVVDNYSRFLFPTCYLLFNCFYWLYYVMFIEIPKIPH